jgi:hypothetical protein
MNCDLLKTAECARFIAVMIDFPAVDEKRRGRGRDRLTIG